MSFYPFLLVFMTYAKSVSTKNRKNGSPYAVFSPKTKVPPQILVRKSLASAAVGVYGIEPAKNFLCTIVYATIIS